MATISSAVRENLTIDGVQLKVKLRRAERTRRLIAFGLTLPLLVFLLTSFVFPIFSMLVLSVKSPELSEVLPRFVTEIQTWDGKDMPPPERVLQAFATEVIATYESKRIGKDMPPPERVLQAFATEVIATYESKRIGKAAKRLNYHRAGFRSLMMKTGKQLKSQADQEGLETVVHDPRLFERLIDIDKRWGEREIWAVPRHAAPLHTLFYLLRSVDHDYDVNDEIVPVPEERASALSLILMAIVGVFLVFYFRLFGVSGTEMR